jgi:hypothetical protein
MSEPHIATLAGLGAENVQSLSVSSVSTKFHAEPILTFESPVLRSAPLIEVIHQFLDLGIGGDESVKLLSILETKVLSQVLSVLPTTRLWIDVFCICDGGIVRNILGPRISAEGMSCCQRSSTCSVDYVLESSISLMTPISPPSPCPSSCIGGISGRSPDQSPRFLST